MVNIFPDKLVINAADADSKGMGPKVKSSNAFTSDMRGRYLWFPCAIISQILQFNWLHPLEQSLDMSPN